MATRPRRPSPTGDGDTLFAASARKSLERGAPLADRMRPQTLADLVGQKHVLGPHSLLAQAIAGDRVRSMILWGPPGSGKTTLARVIAGATRSHFVPFSAVLGSVADLREIVAAAKDRLAFHGQRTIVMVDEIHRFNKAQQDAFLPHVEDGTLVVVGATTENPSFAVNAALLSRCKVFRLEALAVGDLVEILERALRDESHGLGAKHIEADPDALRAIAEAARGDARQALSSLEVVADWVAANDDAGEGGALPAPARITLDAVAKAESHRPLLYDKAGEEHYNVVSAFIKSMRGSDPDAAVYWMMRMLAAGDDPLFVMRRMLIFASEDVGNADPQALVVASAADATLRRVGMPEGTYALAQACVYLSTALKSNACNAAWHRAKELIDRHGALPVPRKLRNAVTPLMREEGYGAGYKYAHDFEGGVVAGETYLPESLEGEVIYEPTDRGAEADVRRRLAALRATRASREGGDR
ncbi:MAG TPA: replication-associated recombination protein A [Polyangiaceae bacterium]|jgi:putative ATPase|nr:replication-associated recombination protein A [Polyangiaceae bacterium]